MAEYLWSCIPPDTNILLTHTPACNHRDASTEWQAAGYEVLRKALWQVRPRLAVCGRIREARGVEKAQWQLGQDYPPFLERQTTQINYSNTEAEADAEAEVSKWFFLDMTRLCPDPLLNNGASGQQLQQDHVYFASEKEQSEATSFGTFNDNDSVPSSEVPTMLSSSSNMTAQTGAQTGVRTKLCDRKQAAPWGRLGRQETLIVNASIQPKARHIGSRPMLRTPIAVDIELPVGDEFA